MSEENRKKEETMEEPTREMEKETGAETDLPETEPAAEQEEAKKAAEAKEAEAAEETAEDGKERKFFKKKKDKKDEKIEELTDRLTRHKQFTTALDELGVTVIEAVGKEFDPNLHNAVMHVEDEEAGENIVVEEFLKGYMYKGSVVRHSMVKVAN